MASQLGDASPARVDSPQFMWSVLAITLFAALFRFIYWGLADTPFKVAGDINDYVNYAQNLVAHNVYSAAPLQSEAPSPDYFRPPGYPFFLWLSAKLNALAPGWLVWAQVFQIIASSLTVALTVLIGREWLPAKLSLAAGAIMAVWPHHVVFASTLLSETIFGFAIALALWLVTLAFRKNSWALAACAGLVFGYGALVNSILFAVIPMVIMLLLCARQWRLGASLLLASIALPLIWTVLTSASVDGNNNAHRAEMNFVQGSWPHYHQAWRHRSSSDDAVAIMAMISAEIDVMKRSKAEGVKAMAQRISMDRAGYLRWYVVDKPYLLWAWDIQLGWSGFHYLEPGKNPYDSQPMFSYTARALQAANPLIFLAAMLASFKYIVRYTARRREADFAPAVVSVFVLGVTLVHVVFQAEPRYSIPYRPEEVLMMMGALFMIGSEISVRLRRKSAPRGAGA